MSNLTNYWRCLLSGAWGGLTGWLFGSLIFSSNDGAVTSIQHAGYGAVLGASIGMMSAGVEPLLSKSWLRSVRLGGGGVLAGALGGMLALPLAQQIYERGMTGGTSPVGTLIRGTLCWALLGAIIGFAETTLKGTQQWKGVCGGVIGGLFGGLTHEALRTRTEGDSGQVILAASLAVLGGAICLAVATISTLLSGAWFEVIDGKMAGRQFDLTKFVTPRTGGQPAGLIGRDEWRCQIFLPGDSGIQPCHATISLVDGAPTIISTNSSSPLMINGDRMTRARLRDGERIIIGSTTLIYRVKRQNGRLI